MATAHKNTSADNACPHKRARANRSVIDGFTIEQRICTACRRVVTAHVAEPATPPTIPHEDAQYPSYWDGTPDMNAEPNIESFRTLALSLIALAIVFAWLALEAAH